MGAHILSSLLFELLEPAPRVLTLLNNFKCLGPGLVLWQLGAYKLEDRGNASLDLGTRALLGVLNHD
jgi:hypothetical protein